MQQARPARRHGGPRGFRRIAALVVLAVLAPTLHSSSAHFATSGDTAALDVAPPLVLALGQTAEHCPLCSAVGKLRHSMVSPRAVAADGIAVDTGVRLSRTERLPSDPRGTAASPRAPPLRSIV